VDGLRDGTRGTASGSRRARGVLVVAEVALAVMLLAGAGLMMRSVSSLLDEDIGVDPAGVVTAQVQLPYSYREWQRVDLFFDRLASALRARPEVASVGNGYYLPLAGAHRLPFTIVGAAPLAPGMTQTAQMHAVDDGFLGVLRATVVSGRSFTRDDKADAIPVAMINEAFAKQHFPAGGGSAIGKRIVSTVRNIGPLGARIVRGDEHEIVGIVADVRNTSLREATEPAIYYSARQFPYRTMHVVMRGRAGSGVAHLGSTLRDEVRRLDPGLAIGEVQPLERILASTIDPPRLIRMLLAVFAALALTLAAVGIYGILTFTVAERRREMSVRIALGAVPSGVLWMVVREGLTLAIVGFAFGIVGAGIAGRSIAAFLYEVTAWDPITSGGVLAVLLLIAGTACLAPAWRASREDPVRALRAD
jgi:putative ABC transport system permease protein